MANAHHKFPVNGEPVEIPVFGVIAPSSAIKTSGLFIDILLVTIDF